LTLNILLSFAQFEREIISERTRDKMSAARRKGKWVGGTPVLGYDVDPRGGRLVVNEKEARCVREIFELYRSRGSLASAVCELASRGWTSKSWKSKRGIRHRGRSFTKASLRLLLTNAIYAGKVEYRGVVYQGEHPAIVDAGLWEAVNAEFHGRRPPKTQSTRSQQKALLSGLLFCRSCQRPMIATYSGKAGRRYRYYVCQGARQKGWKSCPTKSVSASLIEDSAVAQLRAGLSADETRAELNVADADWQVLGEGDPEVLVRALVEKITYDGANGSVSLELRVRGDSENEARS